jgi:hypothetical protein
MSFPLNLKRIWAIPDFQAKKLKGASQKVSPTYCHVVRTFHWL